MIKVSAISTEEGNKDMIEVAMSLGAQDVRHVIDSYDHGYIVASRPMELGERNDIYNIVSNVEHSIGGIISLESGIEVEVVL